MPPTLFALASLLAVALALLVRPVQAQDPRVDDWWPVEDSGRAICSCSQHDL